MSESGLPEAEDMGKPELEIASRLKIGKLLGLVCGEAIREEAAVRFDTSEIRVDSEAGSIPMIDWMKVKGLKTSKTS